MSLSKAGRYQIQGELGRGAMGVVYRGFDPTIGRTVAIKTILLDSGDPDLIRRFRREAQAAGILSHPNIVTIYDAGEDDGIFYIAMEFVEGETLQTTLTGGPLSLEHSTRIVEQVAEALDHAHSRHIVHRDIKPANIILSSGRAKVMDFGVAKMAAAGITSTGQAIGTPSYMSPETVKGQPVDGRSDIFSLGVVLYEMLTGTRPFAGENITTVIYKIVGEQPEPPAARNPNLDPALNYVVLKALAKDPAERYQTCAELVADLHNYRALTEKGRAIARVAAAGVGTSSSGITAVKPPPEPPRPEPKVSATRPTPVVFLNRKMLLAAGSIGLVLLLALIWATRRGREEAPPPPETQKVVLPPPVAPAPATEPAADSAAAPAGSEGQPGAAPPHADAKSGAADSGAGSPGATGRQPAVGSGGPETAAGTTSGAARPGAAKTTKSASATKAGVLEELEIQISATANPANVRIDGRHTPEWRTPFTFKLPAGRHIVEVSKEGYTTERRDIEFTRNGPRSLMFELSPLQATVEITTDPAGAEVLVDGRVFADMTPGRYSLNFGQRRVAVRKKGYHTLERTLAVGENTPRQMALKLVPEEAGAPAPSAPAQVAGEGRLLIRTMPPGATAKVAGRDYRTPVNIGLPVGRHMVTIERRGFHTETHEVTVRKDRQSQLEIKLTEDPNNRRRFPIPLPR